MPEPKAVYEKLLEAQNEQLQESVDRLIVEKDEVSKKLATVQLQYKMLHDEAVKFLQRATIHVVDHPAYRRRKAYRETTWTSTWLPDNNSDGQPFLDTILRQIWLDFLEGSVQGMKWAFPGVRNGKPVYSYFKKHDAKFTVKNEETKT